MTPDEIARLIPCLRLANISVFTLTEGDETLTLQLDASNPTADRPAEMQAQPAAKPTVNAAAIGLLRVEHPHAEPAPTPRAVEAGDVVAFLQAGPGLRPVVAPHAGTIGRPLQPEGALVGYGTPIFSYL